MELTGREVEALPSLHLPRAATEVREPGIGRAFMAQEAVEAAEAQRVQDLGEQAAYMEVQAVRDTVGQRPMPPLALRSSRSPPAEAEALFLPAR